MSSMYRIVLHCHNTNGINVLFSEDSCKENGNEQRPHKAVVVSELSTFLKLLVLISGPVNSVVDLPLTSECPKNYVEFKICIF